MTVMPSRYNTILLLFFLAVFTTRLFLAGPADARRYSVKGGLNLEEEFQSNMEHTAEDEIAGWISSFSPTIILTSTERQNDLAFRYQPSLQFNHETEEEKFNHNLMLGVRNTFSPHLGINLQEHFRLTDTVTETAAAPAVAESEGGADGGETAGEIGPDGAAATLSPDRGRERFWTNHASAGIRYVYSRLSHLEMNYTNSILENEDPGRNDYVRHNPRLTVNHGLSRNWWAIATYNFTEGNFSRESDLTRHSGVLQIVHRPSLRTAISGVCGFTRNDYAEKREIDYTMENFSAGLSRRLTARTSLNVSAGISLVQANRDLTAVNYSIDLAREMDKIHLSFSGEGGFDQLHFNGLDEDTRLSRFWSARIRAGLKLWRDVSSNLSLGFRRDDFQERAASREKDAFNAGGHLAYRWSQYSTISAGYSFRRIDYETGTNGYDDHVVSVRLNASRELWKW